MKISNIKKLVVPICSLFLLNACDKAEVAEQLGDTGQQILKIRSYGGMTGDAFSNSTLVFDGSSTSETVEVQIELSSSKVLDHDIQITVAVNADEVARYNATQDDVTSQYTILPANAYTFAATTVTLKAGEIYSEPFEVEFHPVNIDPSRNMMLPVSITTIEDGPAYLKPAPSTKTAFFHFIGNPLAGAYNVTGYFYHPSSPRSFTRTGAAGALVPISPTSLVTELGDLGSSGYYAVLTVDDPNATTIQPVTISAYPGSISPVYQWDSALPSSSPGYTAAWASSALCNNTYNPATKTFYLRYGYASSGVYRVTEEVIVKQ
ncbi:MAG: DUF1735 domain-containing protein [Ferruginibacter sp.]